MEEAEAWAAGRWVAALAEATGLHNPIWMWTDPSNMNSSKIEAASVTLSVRDIFRTDINEVYTYTPYFDQRSIRRRDQQFFRLSFAYRFGKFDQSLFKRKNTRSEQEGDAKQYGRHGPIIKKIHLHSNSVVEQFCAKFCCKDELKKLQKQRIVFAMLYSF